MTKHVYSFDGNMIQWDGPLEIIGEPESDVIGIVLETEHPQEVQDTFHAAWNAHEAQIDEARQGQLRAAWASIKHLLSA